MTSAISSLADWLFPQPPPPRYSLEQQLWEATRENNAPLVSKLLATPSSGLLCINQPNRSGITAIQLASTKGHTQVLALLLRHQNIDVNQKTKLGATPLHLACQWGQVEAVKVLLQDDRVEVNEVDSIGATPLWWAARAGHIDVVRWMIVSQRELKLHRKAGSLRTTPAMVAAREGFHELAKLLADFSLDPEATTDRVRRELGITDVIATELFALSVLYSDEYLRVESQDELVNKDHQRFFQIVKRLPLELQGILCLRVYGETKDFIPGRCIEVGFREAVKMVHRGKTASTPDWWRIMGPRLD